jgi:hypothetical protein
MCVLRQSEARRGAMSARLPPMHDLNQTEFAGFGNSPLDRVHQTTDGTCQGALAAEAFETAIGAQTDLFEECLHAPVERGVIADEPLDRGAVMVW